jgi:hypothetical protein
MKINIWWKPRHDFFDRRDLGKMKTPSWSFYFYRIEETYIIEVAMVAQHKISLHCVLFKGGDNDEKPSLCCQL